MPRYQTNSWGGISEPVFGNGTDKATSGLMNRRVGALFSWKEGPASHVTSRVGISTISTERARSYIQKEIPSWDLQETVADAVKEWNEDVFNKISVPLDDSANMTHVRLLYSSLYFIHLMPSDRTGENPLWESDEPFWDDFYTMCMHYSLNCKTTRLKQARGYFPLHGQLLPHFPARVLRVHDQSPDRYLEVDCPLSPAMIRIDAHDITDTKVTSQTADPATGTASSKAVPTPTTSSPTPTSRVFEAQSTGQTDTPRWSKTPR